jgi:asparagine synthase (glutamine-hydrolysing)
MRAWKFWSIPYDDQPSPLSFPDAVARFTALVDEVTEAQLVSDVPVGAFLSGGLDSAAIVRSMTRSRSAGIHALTVGFDAPGFDETQLARRIAETFGVDLSSERVSLDAAGLLPKLSEHMEEPTADSSMLPVYLLCRAARERFTVAISGDGADEILAGYETYRATRLAAVYRKLPRVLRRGLIAPLARRLPITDGKYSLHQVAVRFTEGAEQGPGRDHASWRIMFTPSLKRRVYDPEFARLAGGADAIETYAAHTKVPESRDGLERLLHADTCFYLPNDMLVKVDRMSMAHGLEVRVPLLDTKLVGFCANLPADYKLHSGKIRKHILRESLRDSLPPDILNRPKSGFNIPVEAWMRGKLRDLLFDSVKARRQEMGGLLKLDAVERLAEQHRNRQADHGHVLFTVMMLALWFENRARGWRAGRI